MRVNAEQTSKRTLAWAAFCCFRLLLHDRSDDREADRLKGVDFARRALEAAGDDPGVLANDTWQRRDFGSGKLAQLPHFSEQNPDISNGWLFFSH